MWKAKAPPANITPTTPLRLAVAAGLAFPNGGMTEKSLRLEASRGRLVIERIAGKDFVSLAAIEDMRQLCRIDNKQKKSGPEGYHSSDAKAAQAALRITLDNLRTRDEKRKL